jgi:protein-S-isoprenylcysteine O-methyltransferase Ste14
MTSPAPMSDPGVRIPPPLIFAGGFFLGWSIDRWGRALPLPWMPPSMAKTIGLVLVVAGLSLSAWGIVTFRRARTSILPHHAASRLVEAGPYRLTRNPMYTGMTIAYLGGAGIADSLWPLILLPGALFALMRLVVTREEAYLSDAFGAAYTEYRARVRRFL